MNGPNVTLENASDLAVRGTVADLFELNFKRESETDWQTRSEDISIDS